MARNAHPEFTQARIINAATELFTSKGYDETSMQDIIDATGGLSKGAVYHHFKSKEDLFDAVADRMMTAMGGPASDGDRASDTIEGRASEARTRTDQPSALEELQSLFSPAQMRRRLEAANLMFRKFNPKTNPKMIGREFTAMVDDRKDFVDTLTRGNREGSMHVQDVEESAEVFRLLTNMWLLPFYRPGTRAELRRRARCFFTIMQGLGIPLEDKGFSDMLASFGTDADDSEEAGAARSTTGVGDDSIKKP